METLVGIPTFPFTGGQNYNLYLNVVHLFYTRVNLTFGQIKTAIFVHRCLIFVVLLLITQQILKQEKKHFLLIF
jgi:hypothetical protein